MPCDYCGKEFDPISTRWLCPHCHQKANCCDGAPLAQCTTDSPSSSSTAAALASPERTAPSM
jgi:hypothetical protein